MKKSISFQALTQDHMKSVIGGLADGGLTTCSVWCENLNQWKKKDCGPGVGCATDGTNITCGDGSPVEMCGVKPPVT